LISKKRLIEFANENKFAEIATDLDAWRQVVEASKWERLLDVQQRYPKAEAVQVGNDSYTVFNIRHNRFRLVVKIVYSSQTIFVKHVLTHAEYDRDEWKESLKKEQDQRERNKRV
jgi:mRNA interferase HigB